MPSDFAVWRADVAPEITSAVHHVNRYFEVKREGRRFNSRSDLCPKDLARFLPYITLVDAIDDRSDGGQRIADGRFRLVGTKVSMLFGNATGKLVSEHHTEEILGRVLAIANFCVQERSPLVGRSAIIAVERPHIDVTLLYLPFSEDQQRISQFLIFADVFKLDAAGQRRRGEYLPEVLGELLSP